MHFLGGQFNRIQSLVRHTIARCRHGATARHQENKNRRHCRCPSWLPAKERETALLLLCHFLKGDTQLVSGPIAELGTGLDSQGFSGKQSRPQQWLKPGSMLRIICQTLLYGLTPGEYPLQAFIQNAIKFSLFHRFILSPALCAVIRWHCAAAPLWLPHFCSSLWRPGQPKVRRQSEGK